MAGKVLRLFLLTDFYGPEVDRRDGPFWSTEPEGEGAGGAFVGFGPFWSVQGRSPVATAASVRSSAAARPK